MKLRNGSFFSNIFHALVGQREGILETTNQTLRGEQEVPHNKSRVRESRHDILKSPSYLNGGVLPRRQAYPTFWLREYLLCLGVFVKTNRQFFR